MAIITIDPFGRLPLELVRYIVLFLEPPSVWRLRSVSRSWSAILSKPMMVRAAMEALTTGERRNLALTQHESIEDVTAHLKALYTGLPIGYIAHIKPHIGYRSEHRGSKQAHLSGHTFAFVADPWRIFLFDLRTSASHCLRYASVITHLVLLDDHVAAILQEGDVVIHELDNLNASPSRRRFENIGIPLAASGEGRAIAVWTKSALTLYDTVDKHEIKRISLDPVTHDISGPITIYGVLVKLHDYFLVDHSLGSLVLRSSRVVSFRAVVSYNNGGIKTIGKIVPTGTENEWLVSCEGLLEQTHILLHVTPSELSVRTVSSGDYIGCIWRGVVYQRRKEGKRYMINATSFESTRLKGHLEGRVRWGLSPQSAVLINDRYMVNYLKEQGHGLVEIAVSTFDPVLFRANSDHEHGPGWTSCPRGNEPTKLMITAAGWSEPSPVDRTVKETSS